MEQTKIIQEGNEWIAVLPPHPDMPDEELGLPAPTEEAARAEADAYNAITQSALYQFEFDEDKNVYVVSLGKEGERVEAPLLADAYQQAQEAYAKRVSAEPPAPEPPKPQRTRKAKANGSQPVSEEPPQKAAAEPEREVRLDRIEAILTVLAQTILKEIKPNA